jgi:hypothetical protein
MDPFEAAGEKFYSWLKRKYHLLQPVLTISTEKEFTSLPKSAYGIIGHKIRGED